MIGGQSLWRSYPMAVSLGAVTPEKVTDMADILGFGVIYTPGVVVDDQQPGTVGNAYSASIGSSIENHGCHRHEGGTGPYRPQGVRRIS